MAITFPFTAETQEAFDEAIKDRLAREAKKYEGYDDYKAKAARYDELAAKDLPGQLEKAQKITQELQARYDKLVKENDAKSQDSTKTIEDLTSQLKAAQVAGIRTQVAVKAGIPLMFADYLKGSTEEEITKEAEQLKPYFQVQAQPLGGNEPNPQNKSGYHNPYTNTLTNEQEYAVLSRFADSLVQR